jgi:hypothetical protein
MYEMIPEKYLIKTSNPNFDLHGFKIHSRIIIQAPSSTGKTNFLTNLLRLFCTRKGTFATIQIVCASKDEPLYRWLGDMNKDILITEGIHTCPKLDDFDETLNHLLIFDDMILVKDQSKIENLFMRGRKKGVTVMYLAQTYAPDIPMFIRKNTNYVILLKKGSVAETKKILREVCSGIDVNQMMNLYEDATSEKFIPLIIDKDEQDITKKFRAGFKRYLNPNDYNPF